MRMSRLIAPVPRCLPMVMLIGVGTTLLFSVVWAIGVTIFTDGSMRLSLLLPILFGALVGIAIASVRRDGDTPPGFTLIAALVVGGLWLAVSGLRPVGAGELGMLTALSFVVVPIASSLVVRRSLRGARLDAEGNTSRLFARLLIIVGMTLFIIMVLFPFYFMMVSSMKPRAELLSDPTDLGIRLQSGVKLFEGYREVMQRFNFGRYIVNSTVVAVLTVFLTLVPSILGAYAVTRLRFKGRRWLSNSILLIYMFPAIVLVIPLFSVFTRLGLRNSLFGLLIVYPAMTIPVALYMLRSYFLTLPSDIEEAGLIDGCTRVAVIWRITLPLSLPALASVGLYVFMIAWNEFLFAFMFLDDPAIFTLSRGIVSLNTQEVPRQYLMAGAMIITVPIMALFFWFERYLVGGLAAGGVKG